MRGTSMNGVTDWVEFLDPDDDQKRYNVNVNFLLSNYNCIYGRGCPGTFGIQETHTQPDVGCCRDGAYIRDKDDLDNVQHWIEQLTPDDWDQAQANYASKHGWKIRVSQDNAEEGANFKTRVNNHGCVFANRANGSAGKPGCAFHHLANRLGISHAETKPFVCWTMPVRIDEEEAEDGGDYITIRGWDADDWGLAGTSDDDSDGVMRWWCMDVPDAYTATNPVYKTVEYELRKYMGDKAYELLADLLDKRSGGHVEPMPGAVLNDGRPLLPLLIGARQPRQISKAERDERAQS